MNQADILDWSIVYLCLSIIVAFLLAACGKISGRILFFWIAGAAVTFWLLNR